MSTSLQEARQDRSVAWRQIVLFAIVLLFNAVEGVDGQLLAVTLAPIAKEWHMAPPDFRLAMAMGFIGATVGTPLGGILGDRIGRKKAVLLGAIVFSIATFAMSRCSTPTGFLIGRCLAGLGLGAALPPILALLSECINPGRRAIAFSFALLCQPLGIGLAGIIAAAIVPAHGWRMVFVLGGIASLVTVLIVAVFASESPSFVARTNREKAEKISAGLGIELSAAPAASAAKKASLASIFVPGARLAIFGLFGAFFMSYLLMSSVLSWLPAFLASKGFSIAVSGTAVSAWSISGMLGTVVCGAIASKIGSYRALNIMIIGEGIFIALLAVCSPMFHGDSTNMLWLFYTLIALSGLCASATTVALYTYAAEQFTSEIRSSGMGFSITSGKIGGIVGAFGAAASLGLSSLTSFFGIAVLPVIGCFLMLNLRRLVAGKA